MNNLLRNLQLEMLEMLKLFNMICEKYDIEYSLFAGTLLGAVRHKGFIPWDDDLDVFMLRSEYDRFLEAWKKENPKGYFLQNKDTESDYTRGFTKIRKEHTIFLQGSENPHKIHTGIFIDIFPVDRVPKNKVVRLFYYWDCMRYQLYCREFVPPKCNIIVYTISSILLQMTNKEKRKLKRKKLLKKVTKFNDDKTMPLAVIETVKFMQCLFDSDLFSNYSYIEFENDEFMCIENLEHFLKKYFGNYMQLPPKEERIWKHHPLILDLQHDYQEYMAMKKETI